MIAIGVSVATILCMLQARVRGAVLRSRVKMALERPDRTVAGRAQDEPDQEQTLEHADSLLEFENYH